jgi:hypothetical protein
MQNQKFETITVRPIEVKKGDRCGTLSGGWTATGDASLNGFVVNIPVEYAGDGGLSVRTWDVNSQSTFEVGRPVETTEEPTETFTLHIDVKGKDNIERFSDALQQGGSQNLLIEIERLIATKINGIYQEEVAVMDAHRYALHPSNPALENFTVRED